MKTFKDLEFKKTFGGVETHKGELYTRRKTNGI